jgi:phosphohistidine phosphatase SixA
VLVLLLRHAKAGSRSDWSGDDAFRPLSPSGRRQADALVKSLMPHRPARILSSPYTRCVQTVQPLGSAIECAVEDEPALSEGVGQLALALVRRLRTQNTDDSVVLCTHGDIVLEVLNELVETDGVDLGKRPQWQKGSTWLLKASGERFVGADYLPPPT